MPEHAVKKAIDSIIDKEFPSTSEATLKAITNPGGNYTSTLFTATISTSGRQVALFAKVCAISTELGGPTLFQIEDYVYSKLACVFEELQDKHQIREHRYIFPRYYGCFTDGDPVVVMENLMARGYTGYDRLKSIDWEYAASAVEVLARFHALSLAYSKEHPEQFSKIGDEIPKLPVWEHSQWQELVDRALELVSGERGRVARCFEGRAGWRSLLEFNNVRSTAVIVHGDYRPGNLMHKTVDGQLEVIPVDYQTTRVGCPTSDLVYFIVMGSDGRFREHHFHQLLDHYYHQLVGALRRLGIEADDVYGREEFDSELKETLPFGLYVAAMMLPLATVAPAHAPRFERGQFVPPRGELFAERFRELARDWARWGFI